MNTSGFALQSITNHKFNRRTSTTTTGTTLATGCCCSKPCSGPSPQKPGRPQGSKNKPKDPLTRASHYASNASQGQLQKSSHRRPQGEMRELLSNAFPILIFITMGGIQAAPLFDFLLPVIINNEQQIINNNNNAHTAIFFPVGKYGTNVHYQIIRIPIHLGPIGRQNSTVYEKSYKRQSNWSTHNANYWTPQPNIKQNQ